MNHISDTHLREYHFKLLDSAQTAEISAHLETCAECRKRLDAIKAQFGTLDLLRDQPAISPERIHATLQSVRPKSRVRQILFSKPTIAIAACLLIGLSAFHLVPTKTAPPALTITEKTNEPKSLAELRADQPFAPASNIELNVLPRRDEVQLTIYNAEDLTLVREKRRITLKRGWNWLQFMWSNTLIDPTSLELNPVTNADKIEITQLVYPPRLNELARWTIFSEYSGEAEFELTYFTSGLKWRAFYEATLSADEQTMQLKNYVRIDNDSGEDYENAETRLVVGEINLEDKIATLAKREYPYKKPVSTSQYQHDGYPDIMLPDVSEMENGLSGGIGGYELMPTQGDIYQPKEIIKQALSEYQLYTIEGKETIPDEWGKRLPSIEAENIAVTNLYKFDQRRWGNQTMRFLLFTNDESNQLGETPLPEGDVRVFGEVDGNLRYVGAAPIKYIPVGEEVELELGVARKVWVEPTLMRTRTANYQFDNKGNISGWDEIKSWQIELTNTKAIPVKVEITRSAYSTYWNIRTSADFEKHDKYNVRFTETVEPRSKRIITYEWTIRHGTRR